MARPDEAVELARHDVGVELGDRPGLLDGVGADAGEDAHLAGTYDGLGKFAYRHGVLRMVEERGAHPRRGECLREDVPHAAARLEALHCLRARDEVRAVVRDPREVDELRGEQ